MIERIEALALEGQSLRVTTRDALPADPRVLAVAAAIRVFERYPILRGLTLAGEGIEVSVSREEIERLLGPQGFRTLEEPGRWREILTQVIGSPAVEERE